MQAMRIKAALLSLALLVIALGFWELAAAPRTNAGSDARAGQITSTDTSSSDTNRYRELVASDADTARLPPPSAVFALAIEQLSDPFYDRGPNDKGIGVQLAYSLARVAAGYLLALLVAIPVGFLVGMSPLLLEVLNPFIQLLRPVSPLAWMPLALFVIKDSAASAVFVIFICSVWPVLLNTAFGVSQVHRDYINVAQTLELSRVDTALRIILPAALPTILTGMRISVGISWLVIVAAEMLVGGTGIGYYVWNEWNNLDLAAVIFSILVIGVVGLGLDAIFASAGRRVSYEG
jgi:nitrate/nitrite transport system permease protein